MDCAGIFRRPYGTILQMFTYPIKRNRASSEKTVTCNTRSSSCTFGKQPLRVMISFSAVRWKPLLNTMHFVWEQPQMPSLPCGSSSPAFQFAAHSLRTSSLTRISVPTHDQRTLVSVFTVRVCLNCFQTSISHTFLVLDN